MTFQRANLSNCGLRGHRPRSGLCLCHDQRLAYGSAHPADEELEAAYSGRRAMGCDEDLEKRLKTGDTAAGVREKLRRGAANSHAGFVIIYNHRGWHRISLPAAVPHRRRQAVAKCFRWDVAPGAAWHVEDAAPHQRRGGHSWPPTGICDFVVGNLKLFAAPPAAKLARRGSFRCPEYLWKCFMFSKPQARATCLIGSSLSSNSRLARSSRRPADLVGHRAAGRRAEVPFQRPQGGVDVPSHVVHAGCPRGCARR